MRPTFHSGLGGAADHPHDAGAEFLLHQLLDGAVDCKLVDTLPLAPQKPTVRVADHHPDSVALTIDVATLFAEI